MLPPHNLQKHIILCDLDGTLSDCAHRRHHLEQVPKDWKSFFDAQIADGPIKDVVQLLALLDRSAVEVWITSARPEKFRDVTVQWLQGWEVQYDRLIMSPEGNHTDDGILKPSWLEDGTIPKSRVLFALDDRNRVVEGWRAAGIPCLQVAEGDF